MGSSRCTIAFSCITALVCLGCPSTPSGRDAGDARDGDATETSDDDRRAFEQVMSQLPEALCSHYVACGDLAVEEEGECVSELTTEISSDVVDCSPAVEFYIAHRAAIDACFESDQGSCDSDDIASFCPALDFDFENGCDETSNDGGPGDGGTSLTVEQAVVGGWWGSGTCEGHQLEFGWFICPGGRLRGWEGMNDFNFLDCGTWTVDGEGVSISGTSTDTAIGDDWPLEWYAQFSGDQLYVGTCSVPLSRMEGVVDAEDCTGGACSAGGSGDLDCRVDCDCGRCWYCEDGTCRYGGEGPYGCYRGCGE